MTTGIPQPGAIRPELFPTLGPNIGEVEQRIPGLAIPTLGGAAPAQEQGRLGQLFSNPQFLQGLLQLGGVLGGGRYAGAAVQGVQTAFERQRQLDIEREERERERRKEDREIEAFETQQIVAKTTQELTLLSIAQLKLEGLRAIRAEDTGRFNRALDERLNRLNESEIDDLDVGGLSAVGFTPTEVKFITKEGLLDGARERRRGEIVAEEERATVADIRAEEATLRETNQRIATLGVRAAETAQKNTRKIDVTGTEFSKLTGLTGELELTLPDQIQFAAIEEASKGKKYGIEKAHKDALSVCTILLRPSGLDGREQLDQAGFQACMNENVETFLAVRERYKDGVLVDPSGETSQRRPEVLNAITNLQALGPAQRSAELAKLEESDAVTPEELFFIRTQLSGGPKGPSDFISGEQVDPGLRIPPLPVGGGFPQAPAGARGRLGTEQIEEQRIRTPFPFGTPGG